MVQPLRQSLLLPLLLIMKMMIIIDNMSYVIQVYKSDL